MDSLVVLLATLVLAIALLVRYAFVYGHRSRLMPTGQHLELSTSHGVTNRT